MDNLLQWMHLSWWVSFLCWLHGDWWQECLTFFVLFVVALTIWSETQSMCMTVTILQATPQYSVLLLGLGLLFFQFADMLSDLIFVTYIIRSSLSSVQVGLYWNHWVLNTYEVVSWMGVCTPSPILCLESSC
jgi:hypothetical protein